MCNGSVSAETGRNRVGYAILNIGDRALVVWLVHDAVVDAIFLHKE